MVERETLGLDEYQRRAAEVCGPDVDWSQYGDAYYGLGLAGETAETTDKIAALLTQALETIKMGSNAGMVADRIKKSIRPGAPPVSLEALAKELGDQLWYVARTAAHYGFALSDIAAMNIEKLEGRTLRGTTVSGEGDER